MQRAIMDVFQRQVPPSRLGPAIANAIKPTLEEIQRRAIIQVILLWGQESAEFGDLFDMRGVDRQAFERAAGLSAAKQAQSIGGQVASATEDMLRNYSGAPEDLKAWKASNVYGESRAERIAVTETTTAISMGEDLGAEAAKGVGYLSLAVWATAQDDRVCNTCGPLNGLPEAAWRADYPDGPPAHVHCRCRKVWMLRKIEKR